MFVKDQQGTQRSANCGFVVEFKGVRFGWMMRWCGNNSVFVKFWQGTAGVPVIPTGEDGGCMAERPNKFRTDGVILSQADFDAGEFTARPATAEDRML